jgi:hypothetical protein
LARALQCEARTTLRLRSRETNNEMHDVAFDPANASTAFSLVGALALALVHLAGGWLYRGAPVRPRWLSAGSGVSVAYVFVQLLPELGEAQAHWLETRPVRPFPWLERQVYLLSLMGLVLALGLRRSSSGPSRRTKRFWLHTGAFAVYNLLIGGFALRLPGVLPLVLAVVALAAHLLVTDRALHLQNNRAFETSARWILAASLLLGWLLATLFRPHMLIVWALLGLVAGGMILNVIDEELPERREGRFSIFVGGTVIYSILLLTLAYSQGPS